MKSADYGTQTKADTAFVGCEMTGQLSYVASEVDDVFAPRMRQHSPTVRHSACTRSAISTTENTDNAIPIQARGTILFEKFCRFRWVVTNGLSAHSDELFDRCAT